MRRSPPMNSRAREARSNPTFMTGTISQSSGSAASSALRAYVMPPHSSTGTCRASRPWSVSQTKVPMTPSRLRRLGVGSRCRGVGGSGARLSIPRALDPSIPRSPDPGPSHFPQLLRLERRDCADDASGAGEDSRHDATRLHRGPEGPTLHLGAQRLEQLVTCLRYAACDHDHVGIEDVEQIGDPGSEELCRVTHDLESERVTLVRRLVHRRGGDRIHVVVNHLAEHRYLVAIERL